MGLGPIGLSERAFDVIRFGDGFLEDVEVSICDQTGGLFALIEFLEQGLLEALAEGDLGRFGEAWQGGWGSQERL